MRILLLFILSFSTLFSFGQTSHYFPFPDSNANWNITTISEAGGCMLGSIHSNRYEIANFSYFINGDTILQGNVYHKIYSSTKLVHSYCYAIGMQDSFFNESARFAGVYRQDTIQKRIYGFDTLTNQECLLLDFDLNVNDTMDFVCNYTFLSNRIVTSVDSVLIGSSYRRRLNFGSVTSIEGIGSSYGLFGYYIHFTIPYLVCFSQDGQTLYPDTSTQCSVVTGVSPINVEKEYTSIFPNPFHNNSTIFVSGEFLNCKMFIYNVMGNCVRKLDIIQNNTILNRDGLEDGIYFFNIINKKGQHINGKLFIN